MERKRRRTRDQRGAETNIRLTEFDYTILSLLARCRYLTPELIALLSGFTDKQYTTRRLRVLLDHHYVIQLQPGKH